MSKNQEIEAKYLLPPDLYQQLLKTYPLKRSFEQANYYYDTPDFSLRKQHCGLRIRLFSDRAEETLKTPDPRPRQSTYHEVIEINDELDLGQAQQLVQQAGLFMEGQVGHYLQQNFANLLPQLKQFSWSKTQRHLLTGPGDCELTLDKTVYPDGSTDYEL
ncbi:MAG: CYTH domain-containing protein [Lactobacillus sp.]|jgi:uncharacterized protein YjbK|nr:CYTH domain-containing protein [Lactobacillus sp.]MCH4068086.1 CYTH domain-containing protein [Lactobacillus sp.]MCI1303958.1 CYTH domain-containing protein [Lactobacillus sp.]MCI1330016.1 CYTH domain-containing protein [Lactobacillus sp.]MCI1359180.1 CYTH domain-containing protein [Lactobacillus sp.]